MNNLTWNDHVTEITKKASKRLHFLTQSKRAQVPKQDLALFYVSCVRPVIDYTAPVFFNALSLKNRLAQLEKSNVNDNLRKVQLRNRGGGNTYFRASLHTM